MPISPACFDARSAKISLTRPPSKHNGSFEAVVRYMISVIALNTSKAVKRKSNLPSTVCASPTRCCGAESWYGGVLSGLFLVSRFDGELSIADEKRKWMAHSNIIMPPIKISVFRPYLQRKILATTYLRSCSKSSPSPSNEAVGTQTKIT